MGARVAVIESCGYFDGYVECVDALPDGVELAFCPTGPGGGIDPTCGKDGGTVRTINGVEQVATGPDGEDVPVPDHVLDAKTGERYSETLYRATGSTEGRIPSQYASGEHWAPTEEHAASYGPNMHEQTVTLENPRVWDIPGKTYYFAELKKEFGIKDPEEVTRILKEKGHDGLIVRNVPVQRQSFGGTSAEIIVFKAALGKFNLKLAFCPTGLGGGVDPSCSPGKELGHGVETLHIKAQPQNFRPAMDVKIHKNPSREQVLRLAEKSEGLLRGLKHDDDVVVWDSGDKTGAGSALHRDVAAVLDWANEDTVPFEVYSDGTGAIGRKGSLETGNKRNSKLGSMFKKLELAFCGSEWFELAFCPTGPGGGVDPTCGKDGGVGQWTAMGTKASPVVESDSLFVKDESPGTVTVTAVKSGDDEFEVFNVSGSASLPEKVRAELAKADEPTYRVIYDTGTDTWHIPSKDLNEVDHGDYMSKVGKASGDVEAGRPSDTTQVRGTYDAKNHSLLLYDMSSEVGAIADLAGKPTNVMEKLVERNLQKAERRAFYSGKRKMKEVDLVPIGEILGGFELAFCPTGPGGGVDPTCSPGGGHGGGGEAADFQVVNAAAKALDDAYYKQKAVVDDQRAEIKKQEALLKAQPQSEERDAKLKALYNQRRSLDTKASRLTKKWTQAKNGESDKAKKLLAGYKPPAAIVKASPKAETPTVAIAAGVTYDAKGNVVESCCVDLTKTPKLSTADEKAHEAFVTTGLNLRTKTAVQRYTSYSYTLNANLRKGNLGDEKSKRQIEDLDWAIKNSPALTEDAVVFRGVTGGGPGSAFIARLKTGDVLSDQGYQSTTISQAVANGFSGNAEYGGAQLRITVPKGSRGLWVHPISSFKSEKEFVLPRGAKMRITGVTTVQKAPGLSHRTIDLRLEPQDG